MAIYLTSLASLALAALSLGPSFAHVLEAPPRLFVWSPELWREATVFNGQFEFFAVVGAPLDVSAILASVLLAFLIRHEPPAVPFALAGAGLLILALAIWFLVVAPANSILATWQPGPVPADFASVRNRWEAGHVGVASIKILAFVALCVAALMPRLATRSAK